ncbi:PSP1 domain-containing protein [Ekhidna sp.]|uniref:PSP1 domain-containing protein n=1 Tax=Ekhidna sp. TaxID=2608089 RepID=UPI003B500EE1
MGCASCGTGGSAGCKNNGHCSTGGCNKLNVFDWLSNMDVPAMHRFDVVEVRFKNGRKDFFRNLKKLDIVTGDPVVLDVPNGHHIGYVSLQGELVRLQMSKKGIKDDDEVREIYRKATSRDMERWDEARNREDSVMYRTKEIIQDTKLEMKLTDVEFQADGTKATFFYSAESRVDFRELIKILASEFKIRVEMRQISVRQEAGRIGGIGVCGRELCCSTWLTDFKNVSTSAARYQNLSLNPSKLSGQCGRLKCCLNYELDTYMEALSDIPEVEKPIQTQRGVAKLQKTDIFRKIMWFGYDDDNNWHAVDIERVKEIQKLNEKGMKPASLQEDEIEVELADTSSINSDLEAMDRKFSGKGKKKKKRNKFKGKKPKQKNPNNPNV